ncbi:hypothetical protein [Lyngbya confervoides]|uniref:Tetratricopeptide repeat protein n=1 Tax=Lyngbya confervoides BDU141951 TaxID=1574623 RepID=A0ABD4T459_9CYAN|nr:hypothetical protein [Lyngbya confervoides]MCM1983478.1 hypothetical protein [Lyngbya confervoides BDU141951]
MTRKHIPPYRRETRKGKVVYVPQQDTRPSSPSRTLPSRSRRGLGMVLQGFLYRWLFWAFWSGVLTLTLGVIWFSWQMLVNPDVLFWSSQFVPLHPRQSVNPLDQPRTLPQILTRLEQTHQFPGQPIALESEFSFRPGWGAERTVVIPVYQQGPQKSCRTACAPLVRLDLYRTLDLPAPIRLLQRQRRFRPLQRIGVAGPTELDLEQLIQQISRSGVAQGVDRSLPLTTVVPMEKSGWLRLSGYKAKGNGTAAYGQLLYFDAKAAQLELILNWISPEGQYPEWKNVTGDRNPEVVLRQSVALEPAFALYQVKQAPQGGPQLLAVDLNPLALSSLDYRQGLLLARSGLWVQAQAKLAAAQDRLGSHWPAAAQAQLDFIGLHRAEAQAQLEQRFSSAVEHIQAHLLLGSWDQAQTLLFQSPEEFEALSALLNSDQGEIKDRIEAALQVDPTNSGAIAWGGIYHYGRGGKAAAQRWLTAQQLPPAQQQQMTALLSNLEKLTRSPSAAEASSRPQDPPPPTTAADRVPDSSPSPPPLDPSI